MSQMLSEDPRQSHSSSQPPIGKIAKQSRQRSVICGFIAVVVLAWTGGASAQDVTGTIANGAVSTAKMAPIGANTVLGNFSGSAGSPQQLNPLAVANMLNATISVTYVATSQVNPLSGSPTIATISGNQTASPGLTILLAAQANSTVNGYVSGASGTTATLTVSSVVGSGFVALNSPVTSGSGIVANSYVSAFGTGTGGTGTYTITCLTTCTNSTGQPTPEAIGIGTSTTGGLWVTQTGAWTRPANFPSGYTIPNDCNLNVVESLSGQVWSLTTTYGVGSTSVIVHTTQEAWTRRFVIATASTVGMVRTTSGNNNVPTTVPAVSPPTFPGVGVTTWGCTQFVNAAGDIAGKFDWSQNTIGGCVMYDGSTGHIVGYNENGVGVATNSAPLGVACIGTGCVAGTLDGNASDNRGVLTGVAIPAAGTLTLKFATAFNWAPACTIGVQASLTTQPYISSVSTAGVLFAGTLTSGSPTLTVSSWPVGVTVGEYVTGTGIPANTWIASITNATTGTLNANATASGAQSLTAGAGAWNSVTWTFPAALSGATVNWICL